ncbi:UNKNOWN [Stylonychia lemnae]|uniref:RRM domain-containing protein n=1 Tax=Stylonychia lemnae TaxID=5949 RepID=A0A078B0Z3_STYLE|nr:UNKNOWN [Stylonychia lemnae]|eukprot:CDW87996.1 UNKNOWN [Stylonychia lemnae]
MHKKKQSFFSGVSHYLPGSIGDTQDYCKHRNFGNQYLDGYLDDSLDFNVTEDVCMNPELSYISKSKQSNGNQSLEQKNTKNYVTNCNSQNCSNNSYEHQSDVNKSFYPKQKQSKLFHRQSNTNSYPEDNKYEPDINLSQRGRDQQYFQCHQTSQKQSVQWKGNNQYLEKIISQSSQGFSAKGISDYRVNNFCIYSLDTQDLVNHFSKFGTVQRAFVLPYPNSSIGFVQMSSIVEAYLALRYFDHKIFIDTQAILKVKFVRGKNFDQTDENRLQEVKDRLIKSGNKALQNEINYQDQQSKQYRVIGTFSTLPQYCQSYSRSKYMNETILTQAQMEANPEIKKDYQNFLNIYQPHVNFKARNDYPYQCWFFIQLNDQSPDQEHALTPEKMTKIFQTLNFQENEDTFSRLLVGSKETNCQSNGDQLKISFKNKYLQQNSRNNEQNNGPLFGVISCKSKQIFNQAIQSAFTLIKKTYVVRDSLFSHYLQNYNKKCLVREKNPLLGRVFLKAFLSPKTIEKIRSDYDLTTRKISQVIQSGNKIKMPMNPQSRNQINRFQGYDMNPNDAYTQMFPYQSYPPLSYDYNPNAMFENSYIQNLGTENQGSNEDYYFYDRYDDYETTTYSMKNPPNNIRSPQQSSFHQQFQNQVYFNNDTTQSQSSQKHSTKKFNINQKAHY